MSQPIKQELITVYGKFFPAKEGVGTPCYKEAQLRGRRLPKYGTVLFGAYLIKQSSNTFKINNFEKDGYYHRLVLELSVRFEDNEELKADEANWQSLIKNSDCPWLDSIKLKTFYGLTLPLSSFFIPMKREEQIEESLKRFTRKSSTKWGDKAISFVVKADCSSTIKYEQIDNKINHDSVIDASLIRLRMIGLSPQPNVSSIIQVPLTA